MELQVQDMIETLAKRGVKTEVAVDVLQRIGCKMFQQVEPDVVVTMEVKMHITQAILLQLLQVSHVKDVIQEVM